MSTAAASPPDFWLRLTRLTPAAQPLFCALFLIAGWIAQRTGGAAAALPLYALAYVAGGAGSAVNAWTSLRQLRVDVNLLMLLGAAGAAVLGEWWEGGVLLFLFSLSNALEFYAIGRTRRAIRALMSLRPAEAVVRRDGTERVLPVEALRIGDVVIVGPGQRLPVDGTVVAGTSSVDQSPITGESIPVDVGPGIAVFAGTINQRGSLEIEVTRRAEDTTLARIIALVERAQSARSPIQRTVDRFGQVYTLVVIAGAATAYAVLRWLQWPEGAAFYRAITVLVVASPCAIVIATPAAVLSAIANAARNGVLFKGGAYLERLAEVDTVVFDKTGTLTTGQPVLTDVIALTGDGESVLRLAAAVERRSEHALADAVVQACFARGLEPPPVTEFEAVTGRGVRGYVEGRRIRAGSERFLLDEGVEVLEDVRAVLRRLRHEGKTPILVAEDRVLGILAVADTVRPEAAAVVRALRRAGIRRLVLLTGDHREVAEAVAEQLGIDDVRAGMLPEEKAEAVRALTRDGVVVMVGDGVNDAPALASAHVGVAMGAAGTDAAMETADVVLMGDALGRLPYVVSLSRRTRRTIQESLVFAGAVIVGLLVATFGAGLRLAAGVVGHEGSTVIVVFNGLRLLRLRPD